MFSNPQTGLCAFGCSTFRPSMSQRQGELLRQQQEKVPWGILLWGQQLGFRFTTRPLKTAEPQALIQQQKSIAFPVQGFDPVPASAAEQKQGVGERSQLKLLLNHVGQTIDAPSEVGVAAGDIHFVGSGKIIQHDCRIRSNMAVVSASAPE